MKPTNEPKIETSVSIPATPQMKAVTLSSSGVPIELLRKFSSPKPVFRPQPQK